MMVISPIIAGIVEVKHGDQTHCIVVMPYMQETVTLILSGLGIPHRILHTPVYEDYQVMRLFVIHPETEKRLWLENKEILQGRGFCFLLKEAPYRELSFVAKASQGED
jgi:hypothetical protein